MITRRKRRTTLVAALVALGLVLGLTGCTVHDETYTTSWAELTFVKECEPTKTNISATNLTGQTVEVYIEANAVQLAHRTGVAPNQVVVASSSLDATQAQVTFIIPGGSDRLFTENLPTCATTSGRSGR